MDTEMESEKTETKAVSHRIGRKRSAHPRSRAVEAAVAPLDPPAPQLAVDEEEMQEAQTAETVQADGESGPIVLSGAVDISQAADLKRQIEEALGSAGEVRVSLGAVTDLDVTAVQLLWAASRAARTAGRCFKVEAPLPEETMQALAEAGLDGVMGAVQAM